MSFYEEMREFAADMIAEFGLSATIKRTINSGPAHNPTQTVTDHACKLVVFEYKDERIDGTLIKRSDKMIYLSTAGLSISPVKGDVIVAGAEIFNVESVSPLSPAGVVVFWEVQGRQ